MRGSRLAEFRARAREKFAEESLGGSEAKYRSDPARFAREVLGTEWWSSQRKIANAVARNRRTVVKSANGVGKTFLAADLALWYLYTHRPSVVITTAPTWRQVRNLLWEEIRRRVAGSRKRLGGKLLTTRLTLAEGWFAIGMATDDAVRFQGFHCENLLIILDEASGIDDRIWDAVEGVAVGKDNRVLAIGNPLEANGRFYKLFRARSGWSKHTISAFDHPNVVSGQSKIPGAVTRESVAERIAEWCEPAESAATPEAFEFDGVWHVPNEIFKARVLGQFPSASDTSLIPLKWVEDAVARTLDAVGPIHAAVDVARFGRDSTVIGVRQGPVLLEMIELNGFDTMEVTGRLVQACYRWSPDRVAVDSIGIGSGVVDRLIELGIRGVEPVNVALPAHDPERFANRRAEVYWGLRERLRTGDISLQPSETLAEQLSSLCYGVDSRGRIRIESKDSMRRRGIASPDHADMLAMLFDSSGEDLALLTVPSRSRTRRTPRGELAREMRDWG